jgi:biopolymer transport protein ExbD
VPFHFRKQAARVRPEVPTAAVPALLLALLGSFVVLTEPRGADPRVRTVLPAAEAVERIDQRRLVARVYVGPEDLGGGRYGEAVVQIGDTLVRDLTGVRALVYRKLLAEPRLVVSLRVDEGVPVGLLYDVQAELRRAGALRISYAAVPEGEE